MIRAKKAAASLWRQAQQGGIDLREAGPSRRTFCRPCLDWSERRTHLAGAVGASLAARCFERRVRDTRAVHVTDRGKHGFSDTFGIELAA